MSCVRILRGAQTAVRQLHTSPAAAGGGEYGWMHAKQFDFPNEKNRALKYGGGMVVMVAAGFGIPFTAAWWQIKKASGS
eukprot:jgi/Ulvmu1/1422/UM011_0151.1